MTVSLDATFALVVCSKVMTTGFPENELFVLRTDRDLPLSNSHSRVCILHVN